MLTRKTRTLYLCSGSFLMLAIFLLVLAVWSSFSSGSRASNPLLTIISKEIVSVTNGSMVSTKKNILTTESSVFVKNSVNDIIVAKKNLVNTQHRQYNRLVATRIVNVINEVKALERAQLKLRNKTDTVSKFGSGESESFEVKWCPVLPPTLTGNRSIDDAAMNISLQLALPEVQNAYAQLLPGGVWRPLDCISWHRVAVVIPYRARQRNLDVLLSHIHPLLQSHLVDYRIFVVEQFGNQTFNKGRLMNTGFTFAAKLYDFQCFIFHDVDLLSEDDRNLYVCSKHPRHLSVAIDEFGYRLPYETLVGGVFVVPRQTYIDANGYSNAYWGWGAEDDDMSVRILRQGYRITRPPTEIARYKVMKHKKQKRADNKIKYKLLLTAARRYKYDGLNSLLYRVVSVENLPYYTHIIVDIGDAPAKV